jgi:hypothetical protein
MIQHQLILTIPQVQKATGWTRAKTEAMMDTNDGPLATATEGTRQKISLTSLQEWIDKETRRQREAVGLKTA